MKRTHPRFHFFLLLSIVLGACSNAGSLPDQTQLPASALSATSDAPASPVFPTPAAVFTPLPTRAPYQPSELVDYTAQIGDTLPALAGRFNTSVDEILTANPIIPDDATSMPTGLPMKIPVYYRALWGTPYQILPDSLFVNGPAQVDFDLTDFVESRPGWLKSYTEQISDGPHSGAELIRIVARDFSISPRLLVAILEYYSGALTNPVPPASPYILNYYEPYHKGLYLQLVWAANTLNNGYYGWRRGNLVEFEHPDGRIERPDPWQNAGTVALQYLFSRAYSSPLYDQMAGPGGLGQTYSLLFGDPWQDVQPHIPGSLRQPQLLLPFERGKTWNLTGGPHTGWGKGEPYAAVDFAPTGISECNPTGEWVTAMADGVVVRSGGAEVLLDLDGDGMEQTGWVIFYLHIASIGRARVGAQLKTGDHIGHPSCEGGETTGTHVHIGRKYNGEWILASGSIPFTMEGWVAHNGDQPYQGSLTRYSQTIIASTISELKSLIKSEDINK